MDLSTYLSFLIPCLIAVIVGQIVVKRYSPDSTRARTITVTLSFILTLRYLYWRTFYTLNTENATTTAISIFILGLEIFAWMVPYLDLFMSVNRKHRSREADQWEATVLRGEYTPTVDILIPTYNESIAILRRTIIGCQNIEYGNKKVYLLDDSERPEVKELTRELGCRYIARTEHSHAKAGNINHALNFIDGELIAIFDADFVPSRNFLTRTVGFFQKAKLALLQTHQHFFNQDLFAKNLGLGDTFGYPLEESSARLNQPVRDYHNSVMCFGSSFVIRRSALDDVGGFFTGSITEDYFTSIKLLANKYQINYLYERLSAGLVPESLPALFNQRMRWVTGTFQGFFVSANPLTIKGLTFTQRLIYAGGILNWFGNVALAMFILIMPSLFILKVPPFTIDFQGWLAFFLPFLIFELTTFYWFRDRASSKIIMDIYNFILCFPITVAIVKTLISPFKGGFKVTDKGVIARRSNFRWQLGLPIIYTWVITMTGLYSYSHELMNPDLNTDIILSFEKAYSNSEIILFLLGYYLIFLTVCLLALIDKPQTDPYPWLKIKTDLDIITKTGETTPISSQYLSENGVKIVLSSAYSQKQFHENQRVNIRINELDLTLKAIVRQVTPNKGKTTIQLEYWQLELEQYRQLIDFLFCKPDRWQTPKVPSEFPSFLIVMKTIVDRIKEIITSRPQKQIITNLNLKSSVIKVTK